MIIINKKRKFVYDIALKPIHNFLLALIFLSPSLIMSEGVTLKPVKSIQIDDSTWHFNWASFDQDKIVTYNNYQYTAYWDEDKVLVVVRRSLKDDKVRTLRLPSYKLTIRPNDGHRNIVLGISPHDGRLHLSWDNHGNKLRYAKSRKDFLTKPLQNIKESDFEATLSLFPHSGKKATYPRFFNDATNKLYMAFRSGISGKGNTVLASYDAKESKWKKYPGYLLTSDGTYKEWYNSTARNAYLHDILFDNNNRLHVTWIYREKGCSWGCNHDLHYAYSDDFGTTWMNNDGIFVADLNRQDSITIDDPGIIIQKIPVSSWVMNQCAMALDSKNQPHIVLFKLPDELQSKSLSKDIRKRLRFFHYWRDINGDWNSSGPLKLEKGLIIKRRPNIVIDPNDTVLIYWSSSKGFLYYRSMAKDKWGKWETGKLTGTEFSSNDTSKHDRFLIKNGILSITVNPYSLTNKHGYTILDFNMSTLEVHRINKDKMN